MRYRIHAVAPLAAFVFVLSCEIGCHGQVTTVTNATTMPSLGGDNETVGIGNDNETVVTPALPIEPSPPPEDGNAALANATDAPDPDGIDDTSSRVNVTVVPVDGDGATVPPTVSATQTFPPPSNSTPDGGDDTQGDDVPATLTSPPTEITICPDEWRNYKRCFRENLPDEQADGCDFCVGASFPEPGSPCEMFADSICYALTEACDCGTCAGDVKTYLECVFDELQLDCGLDCPINETISNTTVDEDGTTIVDVDTEAPVFPELESSFDKSPGKDAVTADPTTDIDSEVQCQSVEDDYQVCLAERLSETDAGDCETCFTNAFEGLSEQDSLSCDDIQKDVCEALRASTCNCGVCSELIQSWVTCLVNSDPELPGGCEIECSLASTSTDSDSTDGDFSAASRGFSSTSALVLSLLVSALLASGR